MSSIEIKFKTFLGEWNRAHRLRTASLSHGGRKTQATPGYCYNEGGISSQNPFSLFSIPAFHVAGTLFEM